MRTTLAFAIVVLAVVASRAQTPPRDQPRVAVEGSGVISGAVIADDDKRLPLTHAIVTLSRTGIEDMRSTTTDDEGRFAFAALPPGSYQLFASKGAYISMSYGAPKPGMPGSSIALIEGQAFAAKQIALLRGAVIAGRLLDRNGLPVSGASVAANRFMTVNGERRRRVTPDSERRATTNAHGDYRIYGLLPGEYLVSASAPGGTETDVTAAEIRWANQPSGQAPPAARPFISAPTIFPGAADPAAAVPVAVTRGEERLGVDFALQYVPVSRVTGVVTGPDGKPAPNVTVRQAVRRPGEFSTSSGSVVRTGADGGFAFTEIPPGEYRLVAQSGRVTTPISERASRVNYTQWGMVDLRVAGQDVSGVAIKLEEGPTISGRVVISGVASTPAPDLPRILVQLGSLASSVLGGAPTANAKADGTFRIEGVPPGESRLNVSVPGSTGAAGPWYVRSAMSGGRDLMDRPLEVASGVNVSDVVVTLSDAPTQVSGALVDGSGQPVPKLYVFMFSADKSLWTEGSRRISFAQAADDGSYAIAGLPSGEYYLCALTELETALQFEPTYLEQFVPAAIKITLGEGEKKRQDLRIGG